MKNDATKQYDIGYRKNPVKPNDEQIKELENEIIRLKAALDRVSNLALLAIQQRTQFYTEKYKL